MDHHTVAMIGIAGACLDVLGTLYLAYDLLGGPNGPLRVITRAVTYSVLFGIGYALGLGPFLGLTAGLATGVTVAIELNRTARYGDHYTLRWEAMFSAIRGAGFGAGLYPAVGLLYATLFSLLITVGQVFVYARGMRPSTDYQAARRPRFTRRLWWGTVVRTIGYTVTALICDVVARRADHDWSFAIRVGLVTGIVTAVGIALNPFVEYYADNLPERRLGAFGVGLILCGFVLLSVGNWLALLDVRVT